MRLASAIAFVLATVLGAMPGHAQTRVALVISNGGHQNALVLPNPTNDASGIAASPERLGFSVRRVINGIFDHMRRALRDFAPQARGREMAVVYFAGHGMEIARENWLIPVDAELKMDIAANHEATAPLSAAEEQALKPKDSFKECAQCPEMVVVPAGSFTMGSPDSEEGRVEEEGPQHRVTFGKAFGVGKFAVTFEEWDTHASRMAAATVTSPRMRAGAAGVARRSTCRGTMPEPTWAGCRARPARPIDC